MDNSTESIERLKQERNELLNYLDAAHYATCNAELRKERDEALAKYAAEATDHMLAVNKLCNELDEAREKAERYRLEANAMMMQRDEARKMISRIAATAHQKWTVAKLMQKQMNGLWDELLGKPLLDSPDREKQV